jgi:hypothetical protein
MTVGALVVFLVIGRDVQEQISPPQSGGVALANPSISCEHPLSDAVPFGIIFFEPRGATFSGLFRFLNTLAFFRVR